MIRRFVFLFFLFVTPFIFVDCSNSYSDGQYLYERYCQNCHMADGVGLKGLIPPLAGSDYLKKNYDKLPCVILLGLEGEIVVNGKTYDRPMVGNPELATMDIALLINYINHKWGNDGKYTDFREVEANLQKCE